ncbi:MAG: WYL domain-containing protein [Bacteroidales bacterium]|nr:WYL domain-containing protein [Bacteroidales bacterium]
MATNVYKRCFWLLRTLSRNGKLTFKEIQQKWEDSGSYDGKELNKRTFHLHREKVYEIFNVDICCDIEDNYKYYILDDSPLKNDKIIRWIYNSLNVSSVVMEGKMIPDRVLLEEIPAGTEYLETILKALRENQILEIEYQPFTEDMPKIHHVRPYCLKVYRQRWYVLGRFEEIGGIRHFSLDRALDIKLTDRKFNYPEDFSPKNYYRHAVGLYVDEKLTPQTIILRTYGLQSKYLRALPLHASQEEINKTQDFVDFKYKMIITPDLINELLRMTDTVEVLEPKELVKMVKDTAKGILNRYKKKIN